MAKKTGKRPKRASSELARGTANFLKSDDFARIVAVFCILLAVFLFVAIISFFFTGQFEGSEDWDKNWLGRLGGCLSVFFIKHTFGIASLGFSLILTSFALHVFRAVGRNKAIEEGRKPAGKLHVVLPWWATFFSSLFWMAWLSCALGYINNVAYPEDTIPGEDMQNFAGAFGYQTANALCQLLNWFTPILLVVLAGVMLFFVHHVKIPDIHLPQKQEEDVSDDNDAIVEAAKRPSLFQRIFGNKENDAEEEDDDEEEDENNVISDEIEPMIITPAKGKDKKEIRFTVNDGTVPDADTEIETPEPSADTKIPFDINDEFSRINQRAQGGGGNSFRTEEPIFTVTTPIDDAAVPPVQDATPTDAAVTPDARRHIGIDEPYDPHLDLKDYKMPGVDMLKDWEANNVKVTSKELLSNKDRIVETLRNYGIEIVEIAASPGPTVTLYEIKPAPGIRISKIKSLEDDIALSLSALGIRIIAPIPGKGTVGIEVPNANPQVVSMKTMLSSDAFLNNTKYELPIALGKTISNEPYVTDLAKMPHLLMAGATGTGKSVGLNAVITSLLYKKHPSELKFVMVDPKKVELSLYNKIERHYLAKLPDSEEAIITDVKKVVRTLNSLCIEMDQRYDLLKIAQVRKVKEYNEKFEKRLLNPENGHHFLPYIVLVIDEFADLIMTAGKEVELPIARLAQLARAVGIHLIIATQRPTTNIITGTIKANFPARIAFRVTSAIDSRTILDTGGANQLIGRGDMLISLAGSDMVRLQCALIETEEVEQLADFIGSQRGYPDGFLLPEYLDENEEPNKEFDPRQKDDLFNDAARLVVASQFGSTSLLQRKLQLGYNRAGRIIDQLEAAGIVGPYNGSKARDVLVKDEVTLNEILHDI